MATPPGRYLHAWEQLQLDRAVADIFGFHALQLGLPELDALRANRMPHRWLALDSAYADWREPLIAKQGQLTFDTEPGLTAGFTDTELGLRCDFESLPFPNNSLDLVVLPHALELARDPHETLREVERVLVPEGKVIIVGFNPASLWGLWHKLGRLGVKSATVLPQGEFIAYWRLRDWLRLLGLEVETGCFGCYRPAWQSDRMLERFAWMDDAGDRWWPVLGAVYFIVAVKRVKGMHLVGKIRRAKPSRHPASAVATNKNKDMI